MAIRKAGHSAAAKRRAHERPAVRKARRGSTATATRHAVPRVAKDGPHGAAAVRRAFGNVPVGIVHFDLDGRYLYVNPAFCRLLGYSEKELLARRVEDVTLPEDISDGQKLRRDLIDRRIAEYDREKRYRCRDGTLRWCSVAVQLVRGPRGRPQYFISVIDDISRRKEAESRFEATFNQSAVGIAHTTEDGHIIQANGKLCELLGYTPAELAERSTRDLTHPEDRDRQNALRLELLAGARDFFSSEKRYVRKDGSPLWVNRTVTLAHRTATAGRYLIQVIEDITERKRTEQRLARVTRARRVMAECDHALVHAGDERGMLADMCRIVVDSGGYKMAWIGLVTGDPKRPVYPAAHAGFGADTPMSHPVGWTPDGRYQGFMTEAVESGEPYIARHILEDPAHLRRRGRAVQHGFQSSIALPLKHQGAILGALAIYATEPDAFDADELALLTELADDIAFGMASLRTAIARREAETALAESERRFRDIFNQAAVGITRVNLDGVLVEVNQKFCDMLGYSRAELIGKSVKDITYVEDYGRGARYRAELAVGTSSTASGEKRFVRRDGSTIWTRRTMSAACDEAGNAQYVISVVEDITERKRAEEALRASEQLLSATFSQAGVGIFVTSLDSRYLDVNRKYCEMLGYSRDELIGMSIRAVNRPEDIEHVLANRARMLSGEWQHASHERQVRRKDGTLMWVGHSTTLVRDPEGKPHHFITVAEDISVRKRAEERVGAERTLLRAVVDAMPERIYVKDREGRFLLQNATNLKVRGITDHDEIVGKTVFDIFPHDLAERLEAEDRAVMDSGAALLNREGQTFFSGTGDGLREVRWHVTSKVPLRDKEGRVFGLVGVNRDITDRKRMEEALRESEDRYRNLFELAPLPLIVIDDAALAILAVNQTALEKYGYSREDFMGMTILDLQYEADRESVARELGDRDPARPALFQRRHVTKSGEVIFAEVTARPLSFHGRQARILLINDVSERMRAESALRESEERFRATFEQAAVGMALRDVDPHNPRWMRVNQKLCDILGYSKEELLSLSSIEVTPPGDRELSIEHNSKLLRGEVTAYSREKRYLRKDGQTIWANISLTAVRGADGAPAHVISIIQDITDRKRTEQALRESEEQFHQLANNIPQIFWICDAQQKSMIYVSPAYERVTGQAIENLRHTPRSWLDSVHAEDRDRVRTARMAAGNGNYDEVFRVVRADGSMRWVRDRAFPIRDAQGRIYRIAGIAEDITDMRESEERLLYLAHYDNLTSLPNRVLFYDRLKQALSQAKRNQWVTAVMFLDLDRFKNVNDTLGHGAGDLLLRQVSERLAGCVRSGDTVGRLSGDEFAIVLSNLSGPDDASLVAQKIMAMLGKPFNLYGKEVFVSASIGITLFPADSADQDTLIQNADTAMYRAKELGRNSFRFYTPEMNARALEKLSMESSLRRALERQEFLLYYQPKASLATGEVIGVEALLRWSHPDLGLVSPVEFMPMLEETGLIMATGEWVIRTACAQIRAWQEAGIGAIPVAVNLSARQFQVKDLGVTISCILEAEGIAHHLLELEITEGSLASNDEEAARTLAYLNSLGVRVAIDDFGTGYSSLSRLKGFPLDALKIDGSFVRDITSDADDAAITRAIITMAHSLGLAVVAEGVETEEQLAFLDANGCDQIQGYYFSTPLTAEDCTAFIAGRRRLLKPQACPQSTTYGEVDSVHSGHAARR
jgi:diguanylate cyclase (GGDEF)-like protein/PAS domain S-box-containing protein